TRTDLEGGRGHFFCSSGSARGVKRSVPGDGSVFLLRPHYERKSSPVENSLNGAVHLRGVLCRAEATRAGGGGRKHGRAKASVCGRAGYWRLPSIRGPWRAGVRHRSLSPLRETDSVCGAGGA